MAQISLPRTLVAGTTENVNHVQENFQQIKDHINTALIGTDNLTDAGVTAAKLADAAKLGVTDGATVRRGKSIIATEETRTNVAYGTMTTPDQVTGIVLPADGLICVAFQALWKESVINAAAADIFLNGIQLKAQWGSEPAPSAWPAAINVGANAYYTLSTFSYGLASQNSGSSTGAHTGVVTTGQAVGIRSPTGGIYDGGLCTIFAAAGTYTVSVQFKSTSGSVTAKERKLWCWTIGF